MPDKNTPPALRKSCSWSDTLHLGPCKKKYVYILLILLLSHASGCQLMFCGLSNLSGPDPLVSYGRHFGRTVHVLSNVKALITNGVLLMGELADEPEESFTAEYIYLLDSYTISNLSTRIIGNDVNIVSSKNFFRWSLGWKSVLSMVLIQTLQKFLSTSVQTIIIFLFQAIDFCGSFKRGYPPQELMILRVWKVWFSIGLFLPGSLSSPLLQEISK